MSKVMVSQMIGDNNESDTIKRNPKIGFICQHYMVSESCGQLEIKLVKKVQEDLVFILRTVDGTATAPKKYQAMEELVNLKSTQSEYSFKVDIVDDPEYNEDLEFYVEICSEAGKRLEGDDTQTKITIKDEDEPGTISFDSRKISVRKIDKFAYIQLVRKGGAAGDISCRCQTNVV